MTTFTQGSVRATLTEVTIESNADPAFENIDFYDATFLNGFDLSDPTLNGYSLSPSVGPITVDASNPPAFYLTPTFEGAPSRRPATTC